jgi:large subunit ribosomal protein L21
MFAVVRTGGKQYRVALGDKIVVEKLDGDAGDTITLGDVLLAGEGSDLKSTDGLKVSAEIIAQAKGEKVTVFKKKRRQNYRRKKGHRQQHTILRIVAIGDKKHVPSKSEGAEKPAKPKAQATEAKSEKPAEKGDSAKKAKKPAAEKKKAEKADGGKPKAEKKAESDEAKPAPAKAKSESTKKAAPAKGAAKKDTKSKK